MLKKALIIVSSGVLGIAAGWYGGFLYFQMTKPSYGQFGYEFDGLDQVAIGAFIGMVVFITAAHLIFIKKRRN